MAYVLAAVVAVLGALGLWYGEGDDSPGLQGIGALMVLGAAVLAVRAARGRHAP